MLLLIYNILQVMDETELLRLAEQELLGEAKKGAARSAVAGPSGWRPCPLKKTNKTFLLNTILQTISSNKVRSRKDKPKNKIRERKLLKTINTKGPNADNIIFRKTKKSQESVSSHDVADDSRKGGKSKGLPLKKITSKRSSPTKNKNRSNS